MRGLSLEAFDKTEFSNPSSPTEDEINTTSPIYFSSREYEYESENKTRIFGGNYNMAPAIISRPVIADRNNIHCPQLNEFLEDCVLATQSTSYFLSIAFLTLLIVYIIIKLYFI